MLKIVWLIVAASSVGLGASSRAAAHDEKTKGGSSAEFGYVYTGAIEEADETEVGLWMTDRRGKGAGHYDAQDYRIEVERAITDRFQISLYANLASHHIRNAEPRLEGVDREFGIQGLSSEFIYALRKPANGRVGFALYAEPGWSRIHKVTGEKATEYELEFKAIVQKNFADDRVAWAANLTLEPEWERKDHDLLAADAPDLEKELNIEAATGMAYRVAPKWWLGVEGRYHSDYPGWTHGLHRENYAVYAGPTMHYESGHWGVAATWLPQLFGAPHATGSSLEFDDHERNELRLKISREF